MRTMKLVEFARLPRRVVRLRARAPRTSEVGSGARAALAFTAWMAARAPEHARAAIAFAAAGIAGASVDALLARARAGSSMRTRLGRRGRPLGSSRCGSPSPRRSSSSMGWLWGGRGSRSRFAAVGAPLSYLGAERLGAVAIGIAAVGVARRPPERCGSPASTARSGSKRASAHDRSHAPSPTPRARATTAPHGARRLAPGARASVVTLNWGCTSMDKHTLERRLLALEKNAPVRAAGLESLDARVELAGRRSTRSTATTTRASAGSP